MFVGLHVVNTIVPPSRFPLPIPHITLPREREREREREKERERVEGDGERHRQREKEEGSMMTLCTQYFGNKTLTGVVIKGA